MKRHINCDGNNNIFLTSFVTLLDIDGMFGMKENFFLKEILLKNK